VTVSVEVVVTLGAVNSPLVEIVPPVALQVTAVFEVLLTVAENCCFPAEGTLAVVGETATIIPVVLPPLTVMYSVNSPRSAFGESVAFS